MYVSPFCTSGKLSTFTPSDVSAFAPVYDNEYINYNSIASTNNQPTQVVETVETPVENQPKIFSNESILDRVVARSSVSQYTPESTDNVSVQVDNNLENSSYTGEPVYVGGSVYDPNAGERKENASITMGGPFNPDMPVEEEKSTVFDHVLNQPEDENKWADAVLDEPYEAEEEEPAPVVEDNSKAGRMFAWLCYIPFMWILFIFTKKKYLKANVIEGLQLTLFLIIGAGLAFPYVAIDQNWLTINLDHTIVLVAGILGAVLLITWAFTMLISMVLALFGRRFHIPLLWGRKKIKNK